MLDKYNEMAKSQFKIESEFKKEFGYTIDEGYKKLESMRAVSEEVYFLKCLLNGLNVHSGEVVNVSDEDRINIEKRLSEIGK